MDGRARTTGRVIALAILLLVAGAALRGYLPGTTPGPRRQLPEGPANSIVLAALLVVSAGVLTTAYLHRARDRRAVAASMGELSVTAGAGRSRPRWRVLLIGLAAVSAWALAMLVLMKLTGGHRPTIPAEFLEPGGGGSVTPTAPGATPAPQPHQPSGSGGSAAGAFRLRLAGVTGLLLLICAVIAAANIRRDSPRPSAAVGAPIVPRAPSAGESLAQAAELGLTRIADRSREPREAIIACYAAMERHLADVPDSAPQAFDTPTEVLARAVQHHALPADNASRLVELFTEARFSPHLMTERHRADAVEILRLVLDELRAAT